MVSKTDEQLCIITQQTTTNQSKLTTVTNIKMDESHKHYVEERNQIRD